MNDTIEKPVVVTDILYFFRGYDLPINLVVKTYDLGYVSDSPTPKIRPGVLAIMRGKPASLIHVPI